MTPAAPPRPRVLLAEGDAVSARVLRHRLERDGVVTAEAADGPDALARLGAGGAAFSAAVLDAALDGVDGLDVLRRVRAGEAGAPGLPVVVLCWPGNDGLVARAYGLDADVVVVRPFSLVAVSAAVRRQARRPARP